MMTKNADKKREQMMMFSMDDMVPQNHMLRLIDKAINWNLFMIWLKIFFRINPKCVKLSFRKMQTIVIPNPATPNCTPALSNNLGITEILLFATKLISCLPVAA